MDSGARGLSGKRLQEMRMEEWGSDTGKEKKPAWGVLVSKLLCGRPGLKSCWGTLGNTGEHISGWPTWRPRKPGISEHLFHKALPAYWPADANWSREFLQAEPRGACGRKSLCPSTLGEWMPNRVWVGVHHSEQNPLNSALMEFTWGVVRQYT